MASIHPLMIFLLVTFAMVGLLYSVFQPQLLRAGRLQRRIGMAVSGSTVVRETARSKSLEDLIREADAAAAGKKLRRPTLKQRLSQAELPPSPARYWLFSLVLGVVALALLKLLTGQALALIAVLAVAVGLVVPHWLVERRRGARFRRFTQEFPNAVDVVVRGVKSGLPLADCLRIIAAEAQEPVRSEFRRVVEDQTLGMTNDEAVQRMAERIPLPEARFFGIVTCPRFLGHP